LFLKMYLIKDIRKRTDIFTTIISKALQSESCSWLTPFDGTSLCPKVSLFTFGFPVSFEYSFVAVEDSSCLIVVHYRNQTFYHPLVGLLVVICISLADFTTLVDWPLVMVEVKV